MVKQADFVDRARAVHGDLYRYDLVSDHNSKDKVRIRCPAHGVFEQRSSSHLAGTRCPKCASRRGVHNLNDFVQEAGRVHQNRYRYPGTEYHGWKTPMDIICETHGMFSMTVGNHLSGRGCPSCAGVSRIDTGGFVQRARGVHGNKYDYGSVVVSNNTKPVAIICPQHGTFHQNPSNHLRGSGCPKCAEKSRTTTIQKTPSDRLEQFKEIHGDAYKYPFLEQEDCKNKSSITVECPEHGQFSQRIADHIRGSGCPRCNPKTISRAEDEIVDWLNTLGLVVEQSNRTLLGGQEIDVYLPEYEIGIEFCGLYWHSDKFKHKNYHLEKRKKMLQLGIQPLFIFEDEWIDRQSVIKSIILHRIGRTPRGISGREVMVREVSVSECRPFLQEYHLQGVPGRLGTCIGAFDGDTMIAVMCFGSTRGTQEVELTRFCSDSQSHPGVAGKLFAYYVRNYQPKTVVSFSDLRWSEGALCASLGFEHHSDSRPDYAYIKGKRRFHKSGFRKSRIEKKFSVSVKEKTERQLMKDHGYLRIYNCGMRRQVWVADQEKRTR